MTPISIRLRTSAIVVLGVLVAGSIGYLAWDGLGELQARLGGGTPAAEAQRAAAALQERLGRALWIGAVLLLVLGALLAQSVLNALSAVGHEVRGVTKAASKGLVHVRGNPEAVARELRGVVAGANDAVDAFAKLLDITSKWTVKFANGTVPEPISEEYDGEFRDVAKAMNGFTAMIRMRNADINALFEAAAKGQLTVRADTSKYSGYNGKLVENFNKLLDDLTKPVGKAIEVLEAIARRDLRARLEGTFVGDHARTQRAVNEAAQALHDAIAQVAGTAAEVASAATKIAGSSQVVAEGAGKQASSIVNTSSRLEAISKTTRDAAEGAEKADALAKGAREVAQQGSSAMTRMNEAMARIRAAAEGTSQIIRDINEIAFQTNLLALNAAVEAARAGEVGRGFAVVAEEVRNLALRSKAAAQKTESLIRESVKQADVGGATSSEVGARLSEIVGAVEQVSELVAAIRATSQEQTQGVELAAEAVREMDSITKANAGSAEQSSDAAIGLSSQSAELANLAGTFQLVGEGGPRLLRR